MSKTLKQRSEIPQEYKWNIEDMYGSDELWEKDIEESVASALEYEKYQGKLHISRSFVAIFAKNQKDSN